jgi:hypothetical protein
MGRAARSCWQAAVGGCIPSDCARFLGLDEQHARVLDVAPSAAAQKLGELVACAARRALGLPSSF